jgi:ankyrin repeat protein
MPKSKITFVEYVENIRNKYASSTNTAEQYVEENSHDVNYLNNLNQQGNLQVFGYGTPQGYNALSYAITFNRISIVKKLLSIHGIDLNGMDGASLTPAMSAARHGHDEILHLLLNHLFPAQNHQFREVKVNYSNTIGETALMYAAMNEDTACLEILLNCFEIEVNYKSQKGETALSLAAQFGYKSSVILLLENITRTKDLLHENNDYKNAVDLAEEKGHHDIADLIRDRIAALKLVDDLRQAFKKYHTLSADELNLTSDIEDLQQPNVSQSQATIFYKPKYFPTQCTTQNEEINELKYSPVIASASALR